MNTAEYTPTFYQHVYAENAMRMLKPLPFKVWVAWFLGATWSTAKDGWGL